MTPPGSESRGERSGLSTGGRRAVSDVIGFILVFSLVVSVVAVVSLAGLSSLQSARNAEQIDNAERAMEVLADNMADIHKRGAPSRATEISLEGASLYLDEETLVEVRDPDQGAGDPSFLTNTTFNVRPVVYDAGDTRLVYVMGAVFRVQPRGGTVVESWAPVLDGDRTLIPVVDTASTTGNSQAIKSETVLVRATLNQRIVHVTDDDGSYDEVWINVTSSRHDLWEEMLSDHPQVSCPSPNPDPDEVQCQLEYTPDQLYVTSNRIAVALKP